MNAVAASRIFNRPILIHESVSHWTAELERAFAASPETTFRWRPYREELCLETPLASLILLVVTADDQSLELIRQLKAIDDSVPIACLIPQEFPQWEWVARELGVDIIYPDTVEMGRIAFSLQRRLRIASATARDCFAAL